MDAALAASRHAPTDIPSVAVVIPVLNEEANIADLLTEVRSALDGVASFEIVVVNDGSTDGSATILANLARLDRRLRPIHHRRRYGQSAALETGVRLARAPVVVTLDGDGQNDPADIPALLKAFFEAANPDRVLIVGHRTRRRDIMIKRLSSRIANGVRGFLLADRTPDTGCGLKVFSRAAIFELPRFNHMHRFLPALMLRQGGQVRSIPVHHRPRMRGESHYGLWDRLWIGIVDLLGVMWLIRRPLRTEWEPERTTET